MPVIDENTKRATLAPGLDPAAQIGNVRSHGFKIPFPGRFGGEAALLEHTDPVEKPYFQDAGRDTQAGYGDRAGSWSERERSQHAEQDDDSLRPTLTERGVVTAGQERLVLPTTNPTLRPQDQPYSWFAGLYMPDVDLSTRPVALHFWPPNRFQMLLTSLGVRVFVQDAEKNGVSLSYDTIPVDYFTVGFATFYDGTAWQLQLFVDGGLRDQTAFNGTSDIANQNGIVLGNDASGSSPWSESVHAFKFFKGALDEDAFSLMSEFYHSSRPPVA